MATAAYPGNRWKYRHSGAESPATGGTVNQYRAVPAAGAGRRPVSPGSGKSRGSRQPGETTAEHLAWSAGALSAGFCDRSGLPHPVTTVAATEPDNRAAER